MRGHHLGANARIIMVLQGIESVARPHRRNQKVTGGKVISIHGGPPVTAGIGFFFPGGINICDPEVDKNQMLGLRALGNQKRPPLRFQPDDFRPGT